VLLRSTFLKVNIAAATNTMAPSGTVTASKMVDLDVVTLGLVVSFVVSNGDIPNWSGARPLDPTND